MKGRWYPSSAHSHYGPPAAGMLIAEQHATWRVIDVRTLPLSDDDRDLWMEAGMPDIDTWKGRPYRVEFEHLGGARPDWAPADGLLKAKLDVPAARFGGKSWHVYRGDRWPMCSCCGEPMPCRAEIQDREIEQGAANMEEMLQRIPGSCWGCGDPITHRQKSVAYPGDNLDLPGGPPARFHTRQSCRSAAERYELAWIAVDPRRERVLTYPKCGGILIVHADGSSECRTGRGPLGDMAEGEPNCRGHLTHDHATNAACYVGDAWLDRPLEMDGCPRGCSPVGHPGCGGTRRPDRRREQIAGVQTFPNQPA